MCLDNIKDWTQLSDDDLLDSTQDRTQWRKMVAEPSICAHQRSSWSRDYTTAKYMRIVRNNKMIHELQYIFINDKSFGAIILLYYAQLWDISNLHTYRYKQKHSR